MTDPAPAAAAGVVEAAAAARFADFDPARFHRFVGFGNEMMKTLATLGPGARALHESYLALCAAAVGEKLLGTDAAPTLLSLLLSEVVPQQLVTASSTKAAACLLAKAWNVGEGAQRAPRWVDPYLTATFRGIALDLHELDDAIVSALERVTTVPQPPRWKTFKTAVLDLSSARADFVPGTLHAVAPGLLCVHDRVASADDGAASADALVVAVDHAGSRVVGASACLGDEAVVGAVVDVDVGDGVAIVGDVVVDLPQVKRSFQAACLPKGFVAVSAVDSQRLWLLESER